MKIRNKNLCETVEKYRRLYIKAKTIDEKDAVRQAYFSEKYRIDILEGYWDYICLGINSQVKQRKYCDVKRMAQMIKIGYTVNQVAENFEVSVWTVRLYLKKYEGKMELC